MYPDITTIIYTFSESSEIKLAPNLTVLQVLKAAFNHVISVRTLCELTAKTGSLDQRSHPLQLL